MYACICIDTPVHILLMGRIFTQKENIGLHKEQAQNKREKKKKKRSVYNRVEYKHPAWPGHEDLHLKEDRIVEVKQEI